ncbi:hypothetical protein PV325_002044 [Microctonus aethiopoides]|nr:hypothetical protein PV325_002044 [Microctonus aethiopoides]
MGWFESMEALYQDEPEYFDERDENNVTSEDEETNYYCEMCDREFFSEQLLKDHNETHKVCGIDGCTFTAHPKLIEKHVSMQHRTGLYHKIKNLSTPEDIANWINERKRKYPTKTCIELKKAEKLEQQERGEVIKINKSNNTSRQNKNQTQVKNRRNKRSRLSKEKKIEEQDVVKMYRGVRPFLGTKSLDEKSDSDEATNVDPASDNEIVIDTNKISDDEEETSSSIANPVVSIKSLGSLVADYSSDMDDEMPEEIPAKKIKIDMEHECDSALNQDTCAVSNDNEENDGKIKKIEKDLSTENKNELTKSSCNPKMNARSSIKSNGVPEKKNRFPKRQMLLQRLLSRSITHERNFICQCIKYIEDNNYFLSTAKSDL